MPNETGASDRKLTADLWKVRVKATPEHFVYVFAYTWYEARAAAQRVYHESYDSFGGDLLASCVIHAGCLGLVCERDNGRPTGNVHKFRAKRDLQSDEVTPNVVKLAQRGRSHALPAACASTPSSWC